MDKEKDKLVVKFYFDEVKEFENFLQNVFEFMKKGKLQRAGFGFNTKGKKQYELSFPEITEADNSASYSKKGELPKQTEGGGKE